MQVMHIIDYGQYDRTFGPHHQPPGYIDRNLWWAREQKPRLFRNGGRWACRYRGQVFFAPAPITAYWLAKASDLWQNQQAH